MKQPFENSCLKGCLIYVVALALILVLSVVGLGSIGARFGGGAGTQPAKPSLAASSAASGDQPAPTAAPAPNGNPQAVTQVDQAALQPTPTSAPAATAPDPSPTALAPPPVQAQPPAPVEQPAQAAPAPAADSAPQMQAQGGVVSGQASVPFYIVQPGDTLWGIAVSYGTKVDLLRAINKLSEGYIKPGQVLYLPDPQGQAILAPSPVSDAPPPVQPSTNANPGAPATPMPSMPDTGVNTHR